MTFFSDQVNEVLNEIENTLIQKNKTYGNSALEPTRIFSKADAVEQLKVRIDDKLSRIQRGKEGLDDEDTILDLIGYLVILKIAQG